MYSRTKMFYYCSICGSEYKDYNDAIRCEEIDPGAKPCEVGETVHVRTYSPSGTSFETAVVEDVFLERLWGNSPGHGWVVTLDHAVRSSKDSCDKKVLGGQIEKGAR